MDNANLLNLLNKRSICIPKADFIKNKELLKMDTNRDGFIDFNEYAKANGAKKELTTAEMLDSTVNLYAEFLEISGGKDKIETDKLLDDIYDSEMQNGNIMGAADALRTKMINESEREIKKALEVLEERCQMPVYEYENGKLRLDEKGNPIQAKDEKTGKPMTTNILFSPEELSKAKTLKGAALFDFYSNLMKNLNPEECAHIIENNFFTYDINTKELGTMVPPTKE